MNDEMRNRGQYDDATIERPKPCPFCGTVLSTLPIFMTVPPACSDEYLQWKLDNKKILGTDNWFNVHCIQCGATGPRGLDRVQAIANWNRRKWNDPLPC